MKKEEKAKRLVISLNALIDSAYVDDQHGEQKALIRVRSAVEELGRYKEMLSELEKIHVSIVMAEKAVTFRNKVKKDMQDEREVRYMRWPEMADYMQRKSMC